MEVVFREGTGVVQRINTKVNTGEFASSLSHLLLRLARASVARAFAEERDPVTGVRWQPSTKHEGLKGQDPGPTMEITGALRSSVRFRSRITPLQGQIIGYSDVLYAHVHQKGRMYPGIPHPGSSKKQWIPRGNRYVYFTQPHRIPVPRRRFLGIGPSERSTIREHIRRFIDE